MGQERPRAISMSLSSRTKSRIVRNCAVMRGGGGLGVLGCLLALAATSVARAQDSQFVLIDATFTATSSNTMSSEYAVAPLAGAPENWRAPIDYAAGSLHVRVEVLEKPSNLKTLCNVCFKAADVLTCQPYPEPYTKPGVYESDAYFRSFWQYELYDWTKPVERVNVVVKDENGRFVQGNPSYFPTKLHVTVTIVPPGERFMGGDPLSEGDSDAGVEDETAPTAEPALPRAGRAGNASTTGAAGVVARGAAGTGALSAGSAAAGHSASVATPNGDRTISDYLDKGSSCAVLHARPKARDGRLVSFSVAALLLWQIARKGRRHERRVRSQGRRV